MPGCCRRVLNGIDEWRRSHTSTPNACALCVDKPLQHFVVIANDNIAHMAATFIRWKLKIIDDMIVYMIAFCQCQKTRCKQRQPQCDGPGNTRYQTARTSQHMKEGMTGMGVTQDVALDRKGWRRRTMPTPRRQGKAIKASKQMCSMIQ